MSKRLPTSRGLPGRAVHDAAEIFRVLAHPMRLKMAELLLDHEWAVGDLAEELRLRPHVTSGHLKEMLHVGIVSRRRAGRKVFYRLTSSDAASLIRCVRQNHYTRTGFVGGEAI